MATAAVAEIRIAHESLAMADAVVLLAVIFLAVAALADCLCQRLELLLASFLRLWSLIVQATNASADCRVASDASLEAHTVKLAALAALAVAPARRSRFEVGLAALLM